MYLVGLRIEEEFSMGCYSTMRPSWVGMRVHRIKTVFLAGFYDDFNDLWDLTGI